MMFADDDVIFSESRTQVEKSMERYALERRGMKVRSSKMEYVCVCIHV